MSDFIDMFTIIPDELLDIIYHSLDHDIIETHNFSTIDSFHMVSKCLNIKYSTKSNVLWCDLLAKNFAIHDYERFAKVAPVMCTPRTMHYSISKYRSFNYFFGRMCILEDGHISSNMGKNSVKSEMRELYDLSMNLASKNKEGCFKEIWYMCYWDFGFNNEFKPILREIFRLSWHLEVLVKQK